MHKHNKFFKIFLVIYLAFLLYHASGIEFTSPLTVIGLITGVALAIVAHMRHGYGTIILLLIHMGIEWSEYTHHGFHYSKNDIVFYALHTVLDFIFLWQEAKTHLTKFRYVIMGSTTLVIIILVLTTNHEISPAQMFTMKYLPHDHEHGLSMFETIVIGGILGCTLSHLFRKKKMPQSLRR